MMKKTILLLILVTAITLNQNPIGQATDLIISEYIEGSSNNKALEVFNGTGTTLDMTQYRFVRYNNGNTTSSGTFEFVGTLADGDVYVIANSGSLAGILNVADTTHSITYFNGNDYIGLEKFVIDEWLVIDVIGVLGEDAFWSVAGIPGATGEQTLVRKADVCSPTTDWPTSAGTDASDSQWIVYDQNDFNYIGAHTSNCSGPIPLNANFTADNQLIYPGETVTFSDLTVGGEEPYSLEWDLDGDNIYETTGPDPQFTYNATGKYTVRLRVTDNLSTIDIEEKLNYISVTEPYVSSIADLRAGDLGQVYTLTTEAILTYQQSYRNQKYIQDDFAAIMIDDAPNGSTNPGIITTIYVIGDGITGIQGTLAEFGNMMQFVPLADPGAATSSGNVITPEVVTIDDLNDAFDDYEAELVKILDVSFTDAGTPFATGTVYEINDGAKALGNFRTTFWDVDYIGTTIPVLADIVVLPNARSDGNYVTCRSLADIQGESNPPTQLAVIAVNGGNNPYTNTDFGVVIQTQDAIGNPAYATNDVNFTFTTNGGDLGTVQFVGGTTIAGTILDGTNQVTLIGVQMAPEGTNVTITADDSNPFGLSPGTSGAFDVVDFFIPEIIITEIMQDPVAVGDGSGEWFEVYNNDDVDVDMLNWTIKDDGSNSHTIASSLIVPSKGFAVLGINDDQASNGGFVCDYVYSGFTLANGDDEVVLILPDGVTEVDRVNYDGGPVWPDPSGSSMVFTGFPDEDNNVGSEWVYSSFRELSYDETESDKGSPGTNGYDQIMTGGFKLDLKAYLEAAYINPDSMSNYYRAEGILPNIHPFNPVLPYYGNNTPNWLYTGPDTISYLPFLTTDYLLVELRDAASAAGAGSGTMVAQFPAFLSDTGTITSLNGMKPLNISTSFTNDMYIVIWSINHLGVMSSSGISPVDGTVMTYDFSTGAGQVYGGATGYKELDTGVWGLMSGDINGDQLVNDADNSAGWGTEAGAEAAYQGTNLFPDNQIDNKDKNEFWVPNYGKVSGVPN